MTAAPAITAPPPHRRPRRRAPPAPRPPHPPAATARRQAYGDRRLPGRADKFSSIDPLLCRIGLVVLIVPGGVALTAFLLRRCSRPTSAPNQGCGESRPRFLT